MIPRSASLRLCAAVHTFGKFVHKVISDLFELLGVGGENLFQLSHFSEKILGDVRLGTWRVASQLVCYETLHDIWQPGCLRK